MKPCKALAHAALLLALASQSAVAQQITITQDYSITLIQSAGHHVFIFGINNRGQAVGFGDPDGVLYEHGEIYALNYPGAVQTELRAINDRGDIVGMAQVGPAWVYFLYARGTFTPIDLPGIPQDINNRGEIVGTAYASGHAQGYFHADGMTQTFDFPDSTSTTASGINDHGEIVGGYSADGQGGAYLYSGGTFTAIALPGGPEDINNKGQIVGPFTGPIPGLDNAFGLRGYVYYQGSYDWFVVPESVFCDRGLLEMSTYPTAIDDRGEIVGFWLGYSAAEQSGFLARPVNPVGSSMIEAPTCQRAEPP